MFKKISYAAIMSAALLFAGTANAQTSSLGIFDGQSEVGPVKLKGNVAYHAKTKTYVVSGSGADVFFTTD